MKARTKEEKFLIAAYEVAEQSGNLDIELDRYAIGQRLGLHQRGIDTICNVLAQANFIKKRGPVFFIISENGKRLFEELK